MVHVTFYNGGLEAHAKTFAGDSHDPFTSLKVQRDRNEVSFYFDHSEAGIEQLRNLLLAVMDAFRLVDSAVREQESDAVLSELTEEAQAQGGHEHVNT